MIKISKFAGTKGLSKLEKILDKRKLTRTNKTLIVSKILSDIKKNKNKAVLKYEKKFSKNLRIRPSKNEINQAVKSLNRNVKDAIDYAYNRIVKYHSLQKVKNIKFKDKLNNKFEYRYKPINKIGIYVPANLPSTLLMNAIPAKIAGVKKIILANPRLKKKIKSCSNLCSKKIRY